MNNATFLLHGNWSKGLGNPFPLFPCFFALGCWKKSFPFQYQPLEEWLECSVNFDGRSKPLPGVFVIWCFQLVRKCLDSSCHARIPYTLVITCMNIFFYKYDLSTLQVVSMLLYSLNC